MARLVRGRPAIPRTTRLVQSRRDGLSTQVRGGLAEGLTKESRLHCGELVSLPKSAMTHYVGSLESRAVRELSSVLAVSLGLDEIDGPGALNWIF
jgi:mRNA interferase MazF